MLPAMALLTPAVEALGTLSIPLFTVESLWYLVGIIAAGGLVLGAVLAWLTPDEPAASWRQVAFTAALAAVSLVVVDVAAGGHRLTTAMAGHWAARLGVIAAAALALVLVYWTLRRHIVPMLFVATAAFFLSTVGLNTSVFSRPQAPRPIVETTGTAVSAPPLVYIVLDGAMGIEGLSAAPGGADLAGRLRATFERHGFRVYGRAFSRHFVSARSIPNTINFDFRDDSWGPISPLRRERQGDVAVVRAADPRRIRGRQLRHGAHRLVFSGRLAMRNPAVVQSLQCVSAGGPVAGGGPVPCRSACVRPELRHLSRHRPVVPAAGVRAPTSLCRVRWVCVSALARSFREPIWRPSPRGRAYFAHLLMPHAPYVLDASCQDTGRATVGYFLAEERQLSGGGTRCRTRRHVTATTSRSTGVWRGDSKGLLAAFDRLPQFHDATIVIHGDHGPRISRGQYAPEHDRTGT